MWDRLLAFTSKDHDVCYIFARVKYNAISIAISFSKKSL